MSDEEAQDNSAMIAGPQIGNALPTQFGIWALSNNEELERMEHFLKGDIPEIDDRGIVTWTHSAERDPVMNDQGVYEVMRYLSGIVSKSTTLSWTSEEQYYRDLLENCLAVNSFIFLNYRRFSLAPSKYQQLVTEIANIIEHSFARAVEGKTMEFVHPKHHSVENIITQRSAQSEQKKNGLLSFVGL